MEEYHHNIYSWKKQYDIIQLEWNDELTLHLDLYKKIYQSIQRFRSDRRMIPQGRSNEVTARRHDVRREMDRQVVFAD